MALATYADLEQKLTDYLTRDDLTDFYPDFITLFESAAARKLKVRPMETTATLTPSSGVATLPSDYLGYRAVTWTGSPSRGLDYVYPLLWNGYFPDAAQGTPEVFTIIGGNLKLNPSSDTDIELDYWAKSAALSSALNSLYTNHPDAYLYGSLTEAYLFTRDTDNAGIWKARRDQVFDEIKLLNFNENSGLSIRVYGQTP